MDRIPITAAGAQKLKQELGLLLGLLGRGGLRKEVYAHIQSGVHGPLEIAAELGLEEQYVYNIQVSAQGFREDDEIAVAHLVMMG